ncbi:cysteine peptidase family C39 domain-containing protein [Mucilaginibacter kameinonensis]|uniref:cysteine peptidase family C39 domain-containing protein n=1 Tax=Mucilaginibacter kameinonensis TaxID=452286 RepID=UPI000EF7F803|nr:cysteine peptidase family C39 domain-containing protein [Mucilaginibacter kameinonensis]
MPWKISFDLLKDKVQLPCIVHWDNNHFIVLYKMDKQFAYVADPAKGLEKYSHSHFQKNWINDSNRNGAVLIIQPQAGFLQKAPAENRSKSKMFQNFVGYLSPYKGSFANLILIMLVITVLQGAFAILLRWQFQRVSH